jgi:phenylalanyl-tRNA synthetase beta chain
MIVSWNWLHDYVRPDAPLEDVTHRLTMSGLNLESSGAACEDTAIDLEVTSNRPDCLGHIGIAREIGVLFDCPLTVPARRPAAVPRRTAEETSVEIDCPDLCPQYIARVIRGVRIGPSPAWLQTRLQAIGITPINNVVDVTNYVLMECGQPLHAFDFDRLSGHRIVVRRPRPGETMEAIDHKTYQLTPEMCVIADAERPVAIGGVMGGAATEIGPSTVNVLVETANFAPLSIRATARQLSLFSDSSYRFERGVDVQQLVWASNRCCELLLQTAGGELLDEPVIAGHIPRWDPEPITLRFAQISRLLGIDIPRDEGLRILRELGLTPDGAPDDTRARFRPPPWRRDLTRECDLIEEIGRIHGYEHVPTDAVIPIVAAQETPREIVLDRIRDVLTAAGCFEAVTLSFVSQETFDLFVPHPSRPPLSVQHSSRRHEHLLRQSLIPSLLLSRRENERHGTFDAKLFEIADVYLAADPGDPASQPTMVGIVSTGSFGDVRGLVDALVQSVTGRAAVMARPSHLAAFAPGRGAELLLNGDLWGWLGELHRRVTDSLSLRDALTVAEVRLPPLLEMLETTRSCAPLPQFPAIVRDLNFVLDEQITWQQLEATVREAAGPLLDAVSFVDQYRGQQIPAGKKSYVLSVAYRSPERTLTSQEVDDAQQAVVSACTAQLRAAQR